MAQVKLTKLNSTHNNIKESEFIGSMPFEPKVGHTFFMAWPHEDPRKHNRIQTSELIEKKYLNNKVFEFKTKNSTYQVEYLDENCYADGTMDLGS